MLKQILLLVEMFFLLYTQRGILMAFMAGGENNPAHSNQIQVLGVLGFGWGEEEEECWEGTDSF